MWDNLVRFIRSEKPDILTMQDVFNSTDSQLEKRFRTMEEFKKEFDWLPYSSFEPTMIDLHTKAPWGNAVMSKFPITESRNYLFEGQGVHEYDFLMDDPDPSSVTEGMLEAEIAISGKKTFVYSWHGVWDTHGRDTLKRQKMEEVIVPVLMEKESIILAGDSNLYPTTQFVKNIEEKLNLTNVFKNTQTLFCDAY